MINPLVDLVNKVRSRFSASGNVAPAKERSAVVPAGKPAGERLSKTVMPNVTRTIAPQDPLQTASANTTALSAAITAKTGPRMISLGATQASRQSKDLPPAIALALEPKVERAISLQLSDIIEQVPVGYIKSEESFDPTRRVLLKAVEIEKGMAARNPSVALASVYEQIPEIFLRSVEITDQTRIALPFEKVLEQFNRVQVRRDQLRDNIVPQVDTPFLVVALEECEKFGTTIEPLQSSALPSVKVEAASAESFAAAEPEAAESETAAAPSPPRSGISLLESDLSEQLPHHLAPAPARIPFHLPPKGTGAPASERVPASSGPPVLPSVPPSPRKRTLRNPYETVPFDQVQFSDLEKRSTSERPAELERPRRRKPTESDNLDLITAPVPDTPPVAKTAPVPATPPKAEEKIELSLRVLLQNLPAFQLKGDPSLAPEGAKVSLPISPIADQLVTGRISVPPKIFHEAIPTDYRYLFQPDEAETPVMLPLQEVLKNVPAAALQMRTDQEALVENETIETPFSIQAEEDARRFRGEEPPPLDLVSDSRATIDQKPAEEVEKVDAKEVVARATKLPGVNGCAITFADGLSLAGNLPPAISADGLCAVAPTLLQRIERHMFDTKLGPLNSMTLHGATSAVTFFMRGNICLSALHTTEELAAETHRQLAKMADELSRTYSQPEISHVDH